jgi:hypothetical protein
MELYVDTMAIDRAERRQGCGAELRAQTLVDCDAPGAAGSQGGDGTRCLPLPAHRSSC